jgi:S1-C subfamily serine protease
VRRHLRHRASARGLALAAAVLALGSSSAAQPPAFPPGPDRFLLRAPGSQIGVTVRELEQPELQGAGGVAIDSVREGSPAEAAGLRRGDIVTVFDGETVRSVRQFTRLVQESVPGRAVRATIVREGRTMELSISPVGGRRAGAPPDEAQLRELVERSIDPERLRELADEWRRIPREFDVELSMRPARLGVTVHELTPQLADYFGAKDGLLVASVDADSPASRAGLRAGDVITEVNGVPLRSQSDLFRGLRRVEPGSDVAVGIVRAKQSRSVTVKIG